MVEALPIEFQVDQVILKHNKHQSGSETVLLKFLDDSWVKCPTIFYSSLASQERRSLWPWTRWAALWVQGDANEPGMAGCRAWISQWIPQITTSSSVMARIFNTSLHHVKTAIHQQVSQHFPNIYSLTSFHNRPHFSCFWRPPRRPVDDRRPRRRSPSPRSAPGTGPPWSCEVWVTLVVYWSMTSNFIYDTHVSDTYHIIYS